MKISMDFDSVLDTKRGQDTARRLMRSNDVYILTARNEKTMSEKVNIIADLLGIPKSRIIYTNGADKWKAINDNRIEVHYDNAQEQIDKIKANTKAKAIKF